MAERSTALSFWTGRYYYVPDADTIIYTNAYLGDGYFWCVDVLEGGGGFSRQVPKEDGLTWRELNEMEVVAWVTSRE